MGGQAKQQGATGFVQGLTAGYLNDEKRKQMREEYALKLEAALAEKIIENKFQKSVYDIDESGNLRNLGNVPTGSQVIRDRQLSPLDNLRQGILNSQRDISQPDLLQAQINQLGQIPGSEQQIGALQQQYGQSILKQQQAQTQLPILQKQSQALQEAGLLNPSISGFGGMDQFLGDSVAIQLPDGSLAMVPRSNLQEALKRGAKLAQ